MDPITPRSSHVWRGVVIALLVLGACTQLVAQAQRRALDSEVKATYLFNFGQFVRWPPGAVADGGTFNVCILGRDPFGSVIDATLANERIDDHRAVVRRLASPDAIAGCHILFVSADENARVPAILKAVANEPALTVSDIPGFAERGGMIEFVTIASRVRFQVNLEATKAARLLPSAELSRVAVSVLPAAVGPPR